jgi:hypothetical protein
MLRSFFFKYSVGAGGTSAKVVISYEESVGAGATRGF